MPGPFRRAKHRCRHRQGTGLVLGFDEGANVWFAHAVWAGSPAEQAGIPVGAIAKEPSVLTEIQSRLGAAASVGSIAVGWQDSGGALHYDQIRFEPMPDLYLRATADGGPVPQQCFLCQGCCSPWVSMRGPLFIHGRLRISGLRGQLCLPPRAVCYGGCLHPHWHQSPSIEGRRIPDDPRQRWHVRY
jgi:hypothetical protein